MRCFPSTSGIKKSVGTFLDLLSQFDLEDDIDLVLKEEFRNSLRAVRLSPSVMTPYGKSRAWIRVALNSKILDKSLMFLCNTELAKRFFEPHAFMVETDESIWVSILTALEGVNLSLNANDEALDIVRSNNRVSVSR